MALGSPNSNTNRDEGNLRGTNNSNTLNNKAPTRRTNRTNSNNNNRNNTNNGAGIGKRTSTQSSSSTFGVGGFYNDGSNINSTNVDDGENLLDAALASLNKGNLNSTNNKASGDQISDAALLQQISSKSVAAMLQPNVTITIYIPTSAVGAVIGRRGQNITQLQKIAAEKSSSNHPVRVSVVGRDQLHLSSSSNDSLGGSMNVGNDDFATNSNNHLTSGEIARSGGGGGGGTGNSSNNASMSVPYTYTELDWSNPSVTPVVIRSDPAAALVAATILQEIVRKHQLQQHQMGVPFLHQKPQSQANSSYNTVDAYHVSVDGNNSANANDNYEGDTDLWSYEDDVIIDVPISRHKHAAIVGKRGIVLATMSADHCVRIMVPPPPSSSAAATSAIINSNGTSTSIPSEKHDVIQLEGSLSNVKRCLLKVLQVASTTYNTNSNTSNKNSIEESNKINNSIRQQQGGTGTNNGSTNNTTNPITTVDGGLISHQLNIVLTLPITQTKMRNIGHKTDTTIKKKKKVDDNYMYTVSSTLNSAEVSSTSTIQQQRMMVVNNVNAAVALLQKWNSDNLTATAATNAGAASTTGTANVINPSSDSSSTNGQPRTPTKRSNNNNVTNGNNNRGGGRGGRGGNNKNNQNGNANNKRGGGGGGNKSKQQSGALKDSNTNNNQK